MSIKKEIRNYIDNWEKKGIINKEQQIQMLNDLKTESTTNNFFKIIAIIGALFIGIGSILLISSNWPYLPTNIKLLLILLMPIVTLSLGFYLSYVKNDYKKIGDSFIFLGTLLIGSSLALLGQLYNLDGSVGNLLLWWFILTIPITFTFKFRTLSTITISLFYLSIFSLMVDTLILRFRDEHYFVILFTILSIVIKKISFVIRQHINKSYSKILEIFEIVSIKVLLLTLFIGTIDSGFYIFGRNIISGTFQNLLFLGVVFFIMWSSNKKHNILLRNSTFFWIGIYMITKYFSWFWDYMEVGIFFVLLGGFLILLVLGYIKGTKYLENLNKNG